MADAERVSDFVQRNLDVIHAQAIGKHSGFVGFRYHDSDDDFIPIQSKFRLGGLTRALLGTPAAHVTAVELDRRAVAALAELADHLAGFDILAVDTETGEWNACVDPEAAEVCLGAGSISRIFPLDATQDIVFSMDDLAALPDTH